MLVSQSRRPGKLIYSRLSVDVNVLSRRGSRQRRKRQVTSDGQVVEKLSINHNSGEHPAAFNEHVSRTHDNLACTT